MELDLFEIDLARKETDCRCLVDQIGAQVGVVILAHGALECHGVKEHAITIGTSRVTDEPRTNLGLSNRENTTLAEVSHSP